jgi:hypothetical protein
MEERFRFNGEAPPPWLWDRFPNWQNANGDTELLCRS